MKIGELSKKSGFSVATIRFYETKKILPTPERNEAQYREYEPEALQILFFVKGCKQLGFTLSEISEFLSLSVFYQKNCEQTKIKIQEKRKNIHQKIFLLKKIENALIETEKGCKNGKIKCHFLASLQTKTENI